MAGHPLFQNHARSYSSWVPTLAMQLSRKIMLWSSNAVKCCGRPTGWMIKEGKWIHDHLIMIVSFVLEIEGAHAPDVIMWKMLSFE